MNWLMKYKNYVLSALLLWNLVITYSVMNAVNTKGDTVNLREYWSDIYVHELSVVTCAVLLLVNRNSNHYYKLFTAFVNMVQQCSDWFRIAIIVVTLFLGTNTIAFNADVVDIFNHLMNIYVFTYYVGNTCL